MEFRGLGQLAHHGGQPGEDDGVQGAGYSGGGREPGGEGARCRAQGIGEPAGPLYPVCTAATAAMVAWCDQEQKSVALRFGTREEEEQAEEGEEEGEEEGGAGGGLFWVPAASSGRPIVTETLKLF